MIKKLLKKYHVTLTQFSDDFKISRPTLNRYIEDFENEKPLPSDIFQKIFDYLFDEDVKDEQAFMERYHFVLDYYYRKYDEEGNLKDEVKRAYNERNYNALLMTLQKDMVDHKIPETKFKFINHIIKSDDQLLNDYIDFYLAYQGLEKFDISKRSNNKIIVLLFKAFIEHQDDMTKADFSVLDDFIRHNNLKLERRTSIKENVNKKLSQRIMDIIEQRYGDLDSDEINIDQIIDEVTKKIKG